MIILIQTIKINIMGNKQVKSEQDYKDVPDRAVSLALQKLKDVQHTQPDWYSKNYRFLTDQRLKPALLRACVDCQPYCRSITDGGFLVTIRYRFDRPYVVVFLSSTSNSYYYFKLKPDLDVFDKPHITNKLLRLKIIHESTDT